MKIFTKNGIDYRLPNELSEFQQQMYIHYEDIFSSESLSAYEACPFKGGMNQLWRNQLLALEIESSNSPKWPFKKVYFSVVYHPKNNSLLPTLSEYEKLIQHNNRFFHFSSDKIVDAAQNLGGVAISEWLQWYKGLYFW